MITASIAGLGGVESMVRMLASGMVGKGHEVLVIYQTGPIGQPPEMEGGFESVAVSSRATDRYSMREEKGAAYKAYWQLRCLRNPGLMQELVELARSWSPDIIHTHKVRGFPRDLWPRLKQAVRSPIVHTCHDVELLSPIHTISSGTRNPFAKALRKVWPGVARPPSGAVDVVTAPSEFLLGLHRAARLFSGAQARLVYNAPDLEGGSAIPELELPDARETLKLLFLGRLVREKGILDLCDAVRQANHCNRRVVLKIAGDGPLRKVITEYARRHDFIEYAGVVHGRQKANLLAWSHVVAAPSFSDEAFCMTAAEALTAARPVLASSCGGIPEVIHDGKTGWIFSGKGVDAVLAGIMAVAESSERLSIYSARCRADAARFSPEGVLAAHEGTYHDLLTQHEHAEIRT